MAVVRPKEMEVSEGVTLLDDGEFPMCNEPGCTLKAAYKIVNGNKTIYTCKDHLDEGKVAMSALVGEDGWERKCSQDGPQDLNTTTFDHPTF